VDAGYAGRGYISSTRVSFGARGSVTFQPTEFPELRTEPELRGNQAVAAAAADAVDMDRLRELERLHHREDAVG